MSPAPAHAAPAAPDGDDALPRPFGPYLLLARLARGGMGEVFLAKHGGLQGFEKHCVVKSLRGDLASHGEYANRFAEEARVVVHLSHRNICSVFDVGRAQGQLYVAMEHIVGADLRMVTSRARMTPALAVHVISEVLEALDYAHRFVDAETEQPLALVHRDVSPHNVLLGCEGDVKLIDFGIATSARLGPVTDDGTVLGKLTYMSPEHARGDAVDGRSDEYAAAVLLTELLTGAPFTDGLSREEAWRISGLGGHRPEQFSSIEAELRAVLDRALQPSAEVRFPTCSAFGDAIVQWARKHGHVADARDVRRMMAGIFPGLDAETRHFVRGFHEVHAPSLETAVKTPGFETIATTMMMAPTTVGEHSAPPASTPDVPGTLPGTSVLPPARTWLPRVAAGAAVVLAAAVGLAAGLALDGRRAADDGERVVALPPSPLPHAPLSADAAGAAAADPDAGAGADDAVDAAARADDDDDAGKARGAHAGVRPRKRGARIDADTRRTLTYLNGCVGVVTCAPGVLEWSRRHLSGPERDQLADAVADCAQKCRLKR